MTSRDAKDPGTIGVECITPILRVSSIPISIRYYVDLLGFALDWGHEDASEMASVSRDGHSIMLCQGEQGQPGTWIWIGVEDIDPLFEHYASKGAKIRQKPINQPWAYEMQIEDPDGHVLRFGSEPKSAPTFGSVAT
jgi:predicted enzyme related to lactoylglutathione lyase